MRKLNEHALLLKLESKLKTGIGDDAAIFAKDSKNKYVITVDAVIQNQHFTLKDFTFEEIGQKAMAVNLSDIAAMGAKPVHALVSLGLPGDFTENQFWKLYKGLVKTAQKFKTQIIGGNISRSEKLFLDVTLIGEAASPLLRSSAKVGDAVVVTGHLGLAAAGYHLIGKKIKTGFKQCFKAQKTPSPKILQGLMLSKMGAHACIDISDGLSSELHLLAKASRVGFEIDKLPIHPQVQAACKKIKLNPIDLILNGGEDYELLATIPPSKLKNLQRVFKSRGWPLFVIGGVVSRGKGNLKIIPPRGFDHFSV